RGGAELRLGLSQPVPYRVFLLDDPWRLVLDFSVVSWEGFNAEAFDQSDAVSHIKVGAVQSDWSRIVLLLEAPLVVTSAELRTGAASEIVVRLEKVAPEAFAAQAGAPESAVFARPEIQERAVPPQDDGTLMVVLDPGHGGLDPGAQRGNVDEADLMLIFARELREVLLRAGGFDVMMTRDDDIFVPLETRQSVARAVGADVFISLHADALVEGVASGATVYTLAPEASDIASQRLAERHDRADLLAGVDLTEQDDNVAMVLMELARTETMPRTDKLADALVTGLRDNIGNMHRRPRLEAAFSVLKSPDIPSVLIELGFMSSAGDLANLQSPEWRARAAVGIRDALRAWAAADAADRELLRQ
ncbi:MAG: N-acetylmuramoyl-L-alanine amidase, partial [Pseudomonadota bacterium]